MNTIAYLEDELKRTKRDLNFYKTISNRLKDKNKKQKEVIDKIKNILNNQMDYREFVDMINAIEDILKEVENE